MPDNILHRPIAFAVLFCAACGGSSGAQTAAAPAPVVLPPLPPPADAPGSAEEAARSLAAKVLKGDLPALVTALRASGFALTEADGSVVVAPAGPAQGIAIQRWEVIGLGQEAATGTMAAAADVGAALAVESKRLDSAKAAAALIEGLRKLAASGQPTLRFFALFIAELGRQGPQRQDLLSVDASQAVLGGVQVSLLLRRVVAELTALRLGGAPPRPSRRQLASTALTESASPCQLTEAQSQILDVAAIAAGMGFDKLIETLLENEHMDLASIAKPENAARAAHIGNAVLAYAKLWLYWSAFKITVEPASTPLERTRTTSDGQRVLLTAAGRFDAGNTQWINCARPVFNALGLDLSGPSTGLVSDAPGRWEMLEGGVVGLDLSHRIVQFAGDAGLGISGDIVHARTDERGEMKIFLEGYRQKALIPETAPRVMKTAKVAAWITPKPPNIVQDLIDAAAASLGGFVALLGTIPAEMVLRTNAFKGQELEMPVHDWGFATWDVEGTLKESSIAGTCVQKNKKVGCKTALVAQFSAVFDWNESQGRYVPRAARAGATFAADLVVPGVGTCHRAEQIPSFGVELLDLAPAGAGPAGIDFYATGESVTFHLCVPQPGGQPELEFPVPFTLRSPEFRIDARDGATVFRDLDGAPLGPAYDPRDIHTSWTVTVKAHQD